MKTFCALPFSHLFLSEEGKSFPCCYALETGAVNTDETGQEIFVRDEASLKAAWESQNGIRKQMLESKRPGACARCFQLEDHGLQSLREVSNKRYADLLDSLKANAKSDGSSPMLFYSADLRLGNQCNLRCQMCSPVSSRKLVDDFKKLYPGSDYSKFEKLDWPRDPKLLELLLDHSSEIREMHFAGGEPFLIPETEIFVRALAATPQAKNMRLSFNTNGTLLPEELLRLFPAFDSVRLIVSLDGVGKVNDYIRFPAKFERIDANLKELHKRRGEWNLSYVFINSTVQVHNIFHLPELIDYVVEEFEAFPAFPILGTLHVPECLSIQALPRETKLAAKEKLEAFIRERRMMWLAVEQREPDPGGAERFDKRIHGIIQFMMEKDHPELLPELQRFNEVITGIRGQKLAVPGL